MNTNYSVKDIILDIERNFGNKKVYNMLLKAYNQYQEDERDGVDYLFKLTNQNDLALLVKNGLTAKEISQLYTDKNSETYYFYYGVNHTELKCLSIDELDEQIYNNIENIVKYMLAYPFIDAYKDLYIEFVTNKILGE